MLDGNRTQSRSPRKLITRALASIALLTMYGLGMIATTGAAMTMASTPAFAQRGRGGGGRGGGGRGGGRGRGGGWGGPGAGAAIGLGIGAAIIGGAIAASEAEAARRRDAAGYCMQRYRSYNPETGTYIGRDGMERPCP